MGDEKVNSDYILNNSNCDLGVVNLHFTNKCNNHCLFCHSGFLDSVERIKLESSEWKEIINLLRPFCSRINFAGGEPLTEKQLLSDLLEHNNELSLISTMITNGDLLDEDWLNEHGHLISAIGISCDSSIEEVQFKLGRGRGNHVENTLKKFQMISDYNSHSGRILMKLNTVVNRLNYEEDMTDFVRETGVSRWKCFQLLEIVGENSEQYGDLRIDEDEFAQFIRTNDKISQRGVKAVFEDRHELIDTYVMVNPEGKLFSNRGNVYRKSEPIIEVGVETALQQIGFNQSNLEGIDRMFL